MFTYNKDTYDPEISRTTSGTSHGSSGLTFPAFLPKLIEGVAISTGALLLLTNTAADLLGTCRLPILKASGSVSGSIDLLVIFWLVFVWSYIVPGCLGCFLSFEHADFDLGLFCFFSMDFRDLNFFWRNVFSPALIGKNIGQTLTG